MTIEETAELAALFDSAVFAEAGTYLPAAGGQFAVTVILDRGQRAAGLGQIGVSQEVYIGQIRASEVETPIEDDQLLVGSQTFRVRNADRDIGGSIWTLDLDLQA